MYVLFFLIYTWQVECVLTHLVYTASGLWHRGEILSRAVQKTFRPECLQIHSKLYVGRAWAILDASLRAWQVLGGCGMGQFAMGAITPGRSSVFLSVPVFPLFPYNTSGRCQPSLMELRPSVGDGSLIRASDSSKVTNTPVVCEPSLSHL